MRVLILGLISLIFCLKTENINTVQDCSDVEWDKDAGLIHPYPASLSASSASADLHKITDLNNETFWQSEAPFPDAFIKRSDLNIFYQKGQELSSCPNLNDFKKLTDGDLNNAIEVNNSSGKNWLSLNFKTAQSIQFLFIKCGNAAHIELMGNTKDGNFRPIGTYTAKESYTWKRLDLKKASYQNILVRSDQAFQLFEVAALADLPKEYVIADFGAPKEVGTIYCRHFAGDNNATATKFYLSSDKKNWQEVADLQADLKHTIITNVEPPVRARFLKVEHTLKPTDWNKVFLWELAVYDQNGHYGAMPKAQPSRVTIREMLGVNGTWGWGHNKYSDLLKAGEGPQLYAPISSHARNYHDLQWDIKSTKDAPNYQKMAAGKGTDVHWWLNWNQEYKAWASTKMNVQATIQIHHFKDSDWAKPYENAFAIGTNFAQHFGATKGNGLVCTMEAGNEPWKYEATTYQQILLGMAKGAKTVDPNMEVFPCALQAADPAMENTDIFKNYMGARLTAEAAPYLDGINIHCYSYLNQRDGQRIAVEPEHPNSSFREINNAVNFRNQNMPGKKIYLSEWGWDGSGGGEGCTHSECVSEKAMSNYGIRGAMMALRLGVDRASWFFFANEKRPSSLYTRSGLTGSVETDFRKKRVFKAFENLIDLVGDKYFINTIQENDDVWAYALGDEIGQVTHLMLWSPMDGDAEDTTIFKWKTSLKAKKMVKIDGLTPQGKVLKVPEFTRGMMNIEVGTMPIILELE